MDLEVEIKKIILTCVGNDQILKFTESELKDMIVDGNHLKKMNSLIHKLALCVQALESQLKADEHE